MLRPDAFLLDCLEDDQERVLEAVKRMAARHRNPTHSVEELAALIKGGRHVARFGTRLVALLG